MHTHNRLGGMIRLVMERWRLAIDWRTLRSALFRDDHDRLTSRDVASRGFTREASPTVTVRRRLRLLAGVLALGLVASACAGGFENGGEGNGRGDRGGDVANAAPDSAPGVNELLIPVLLEPSLVDAAPEQGFQFEREGYFVADRRDHTPQHPVFNKTIGLRDTWSG